MKIKQAEYIASFPNVASCPQDSKPEFAFIGRSNVGKSSLINMLTNKKGLAKVSVTPGKTQMLNFLKSITHGCLLIYPVMDMQKLQKLPKLLLAR
jgi:GTP-binding protein